MNNKTFILIFVAIVFVVGGILYVNNPEPIEYQNPEVREPIVCTADAMLCPNGSYVGRQAPNCEFAACPIPNDAIMEDGTL